MSGINGGDGAGLRLYPPSAEPVTPEEIRRLEDVLADNRRQMALLVERSNNTAVQLLSAREQQARQQDLPQDQGVLVKDILDQLVAAFPEIEEFAFSCQHAEGSDQVLEMSITWKAPWVVLTDLVIRTEGLSYPVTMSRSSNGLFRLYIGWPEAQDTPYTARAGVYKHPHVDSSGHPCLSSTYDILQEFVRKNDYVSAVQMVNAWLGTYDADGGPYCHLTDFVRRLGIKAWRVGDGSEVVFEREDEDEDEDDNGIDRRLHVYECDSCGDSIYEGEDAVMGFSRPLPEGWQRGQNGVEAELPSVYCSSCADSRSLPVRERVIAGSDWARQVWYLTRQDFPNTDCPREEE